MVNADALFDLMRNVSDDLARIQRLQSEYALQAAESNFAIQKKVFNQYVCILQRHNEDYTKWLANLNEIVIANNLHRLN
jgi:hypothetical protein